jgi:KaiC/GvpD/RAD55 family RecA-like ATPase
MSQQTRTQYEFEPDLSISGIEAGTNLLVTGPSESGAREVALRLVMDGMARDEGALLVSADMPGQSLLTRCDSIASPIDRTRLAMVDCAGPDVDQQRRFESRHEPIEGPGDLAAINVELSILYETLAEQDLPGIRIGVFSVSSLLMHASYRDVSRFVHMVTGRVIATGDLGVYLVDESALERTAVDSLTAFCDGCIDVRTGEETRYELRVRNLEDHSEEWRPLDIEPET